MIVLITMICGVTDLAAMIAIFGVNACMILFGLLTEKYERPGKPGWLPFYFGCFAGAISWIGRLIYVWGPGFGANPPGFVYGIIVSLFGEKVYIVPSLTAKALLAWQVFASVLAG
jgi:hypothetical protein